MVQHDLVNDALSLYDAKPRHSGDRSVTKKAETLKSQDLKKLLKLISISNHAKRDTLLVLMSFGLGLRAVELAGLKVGDVLKEDGSIMEQVRLTRTKNNKVRAVFLADERIKKALYEYLGERKQDLSLTFSLHQPLFMSQKKCGFTNRTMQKKFEKLYRNAGFTKASSHSGRRTFATNLIQQGMDIRAVQLLMGHSNINQTADYVACDEDRLYRITANALQL